MDLSVIWRSGCTYNGVRFHSMRNASLRRKMSFEYCYNRRRFNDLEKTAGSVKMGHVFHRHSQGENVKSFVLST